MKIASKHNLKIIEDCAEAHGAMYEGQKLVVLGYRLFLFFGTVITTGEGVCV